MSKIPIVMNNKSPGNTSEQRLLTIFLILYFLLFLFAGVIIQKMSGKPPQVSGRLDSMTSSLLWATSIFAFLIALEKIQSYKKFLFWVLVSASFGILAIDEISEFHEHTERILEDDDYIKIMMWLCGGIGIYMIYIIDKPIKIAIYLLIIGYIFHCIYILIDIGDGDFFTIPLAPMRLFWLEETFEVLAIQSYLIAFILQYRSILKEIQ